MRIKKSTGVFLILLSTSIYYTADFWLFQAQSPFGSRLLWSSLYLVTLLGMIGNVFAPQTERKPVAPGKLVAIVPVYNESPDVLKQTIEALLRQTVEIDEIYVIDDGSDQPMQPYCHPRVFCHWQKNTGKRGAQAKVLRNLNQDEVTFILTVDSDSKLDPHAVEYMKRALTDPEVAACSGRVLLSNFDANLLTRIQEFNYGNAFSIGRSARRTFGILETTSGACSMYRAPILFFHLEDYLTSGTSGDDRRLCIYSLLEGKVLYVPEAIAYTEAPTGFKALWRQRLRWAKSGWRALPVFLTNFGLRVSFFPLLGFFITVITPFALASMILNLTQGSWNLIMRVALFYLMNSYCKSAFYVAARKKWNKRKKFICWLTITPLLPLLYFFVSLPVKYLALFKLKDYKWGTRGATQAISKNSIVQKAAPTAPPKSATTGTHPSRKQKNAARDGQPSPDQMTTPSASKNRPRQAATQEFHQ